MRHSRMRSAVVVSVSISILISAAFFTGCAAGKKSADNDSSLGSRIDSDSGIIVVSPKGDIYVQGMKLQNTKFDFPITVNSRVEYWLDYFQTRGRKHFARYLERSEHFVPYIVPILKQNNMPEDLVYLAMIESGFNNHARSSARAVGPWQFISGTGKRFGLMINWWVDERRDTRKSTLAAVQYLKDLHEIFQSWELAAAAYNAGEAKVARAVRRYGTKDFWTIARHKFLRPETRDYVPKIIAAALIAKNRTQFGFEESKVKPGEGEAIAGDGEVVKVVNETENSQTTAYAAADSISSVLQQDEYDAYEAAPEEITPAIATVPGESQKADELVSNSVENGSVPLAKPISMPSVSKKGEISGEELAEFEVQSPADLLKIARAAGLSYQTVKALNPELLRWCTPPTVASYRLKLPASVKERFLGTYNHPSYPRKVQFLTYKARKGETLARIARHFGIKSDPISELNGVSPRMPLRNGVRILLPMPNDQSRSVASLEVRDPPEKRRIRRKRYSRAYRVSYDKRVSARANADGT